MQSTRLAVLLLLFIMWVMILVQGLARLVTGDGWFAVLCAVTGLVGLGAQVWLTFFADHWKGYTPTAGITVERAAEDPSVLAHHRNLFGPGKVRNVITGADFVAFEVVHRARRRWFFVTQVPGGEGRWRVRPRVTGSTVRGGRPPLAARYVVDGAVPTAVERILLSRPFAELDVRQHDGLLVACDSFQGAKRFPTWLAREGVMVREMAQALSPFSPGRDAAPALPASDPSRNLWQAPEMRDAPSCEGASRWRQPPMSR